MHLLLSLLTFVLPLPPGLPWFSLPSVPAVTQETKLVVQVEELGGVTVGSNVRIAGQIVGKVSAVIKAGKDESRHQAYKLELGVTPEYAPLLKAGTVALVTSPLVLGQQELGTVVDLMIPVESSGRMMANGTQIPGYTSYEKFWSADFSKAGISQSAFQPS